MQKGYTDMDAERHNPVSIAAIQTKQLDILHGTFRADLKVTGYNGGSCASFFWYHDDTSEIDIEIVTPGTSLVNDTIDYTSHPALNADGSKIPGATLERPLANIVDGFKIHRFDCSPGQGVQYYLDNQLMHTNTRNVPQLGGSLQLKLWADGNKWWSGRPSKSDVAMHVKSIVAYFNTTASGTDVARTNACAVKKSKCTATYLPSKGEQNPQVALPQQLASSPLTRRLPPHDGRDTITSRHSPVTPEDARAETDDMQIPAVDAKLRDRTKCPGHGFWPCVIKTKPTSNATKSIAMSYVLHLAYAVVIFALIH